MFIKSKTIIPLIAGIILLIAGGLLYARKPAPQTPPTTIENTGTPVVEKDEIDMSGWKTYQNEKYGFELKYQPYWETAATDVGVNEENRHYLLDYLAFNNNKNINSKNASPFLSIALIDTKRDDRRPIDYGELITTQAPDDLEIKIFLDMDYFGYSATAFVRITNTENLEIRIAQIEQKEETLKTLNEILNTIKK